MNILCRKYEWINCFFEVVYFALNCLVTSFVENIHKFFANEDWNKPDFTCLDSKKNILNKKFTPSTDIEKENRNNFLFKK